MIPIEVYVYQQVKQGEAVVLATILSQFGSTPRKTGKMAVLKDGSLCGTIGGGLLEAKVLKAAENIFSTRHSEVRSYSLDAPACVDSTEMICGGTAEILIDYLEASSFNVGIFSRLALAGKNGTKSFLLTLLPDGDQNSVVRRCLVNENGSVYGDLAIATSLKEELLSIDQHRASFVVNFDSQSFLVETFTVTPKLYLLGAGHIAQEVAYLTRRLDFELIVLDDRREFANPQRFPEADKIIVLDSFKSALAEQKIDLDSYIVIVTRGHQHDKIVLGQALKTKACYIGMIGSMRKRNAIYQALLEDGFTPKDLERVHCPIGLKISAESPQEIAISIAAELIATRATRKSADNYALAALGS